MITFNMASSPVLPKILSNAAVLASGPSYHGVPPPKEDVAKLNANEMNYGAHPEVLKAAEAATKFYHVYPDPAQSVLRSKIAQTHPGFSKDNVVAGVHRPTQIFAATRGDGKRY